MPHITANRVRHHVQRLGEGRPIVMLHGMSGNLSCWYYTAAPVLAKSRSVLLYDFRGHGYSERVRSGYNVREMARDLIALMDEFFDEPCTLVGYSYGALIALRIAIDHPERVSRLVLVETPAPPADIRRLAVRDPQVAARMSPAEVAHALRTNAISIAAAYGVPENPGRRSRRRFNEDRFLLFESTLYEEMAAEPDFSDTELAQVTHATLCLYGDRSNCLAVSERLLRCIPDARLTLLPDCGHYVMQDAPRLATEKIAEFVGHA